MSSAPVAEQIGEGIARYHADASARDAALPSIMLAREFPALGPAPKSRRKPEFKFERGGWVIHLTTEPGTSLYGTGEAAGPLRRNGRVVTCWNSDHYAWGADTPSLYQSHPWVLAVRADGSAYGVLADTPGRIVVDLRRGIEFRAQGPAFPVIVIERASPGSVLTALADLTGRMALPPLWALGYQQCRYSYFPDREVLRVAREFRRRKIPCDAIWMDIDYMDGFRSFTFHPTRFPRPAAVNDTLHQLGYHSVWMIDPGLKLEPGWKVYDQGTRGDHWVQNADGTPFIGRVWPGACVFPDFTRAETRGWWASLYRDFVSHGVDGVWNDMNEPAVFDQPTKTMPENVHHRADAELGGPGPHLRYHNVYGMQMARATREGLLTANPERRPFVLTRAGHMGYQRYAATWTGDNIASWEHLEMSVSVTLNLGLSGQPFSGPDIGGYKGHGEPKLYARWMGVGALLPFARAHTEKGNPSKEPWSFGPETEATCRRAIETRYRLLPFLYTLFEEASRTGLPVARPVFFADPTDTALRDEDSAFLLGSDVWVAAELTGRADAVPALPGRDWAELAAFGALANGAHDPDLPRLFLRPGAILPVGPVRQHVGGAVSDTLDLFVCLDDRGEARGVLYEDAGDGFSYRNGEFRRTHWSARKASGAVRVEVARTEGSWTAPERPFRVSVIKREGRARGR